MATTRDNTISIVKGLAIILMVMGHAEGPSWLMRFIYLFHMPVFFITAGYFFSKKYLDDPWAFCVKRFKGLYVPFVKWSLFFLVIHNLLFKIGILNEQYGNWENGVTHPYTLHTFMQRLFNIVFSMGGYDEFLAGAFWFFRALFITSIVFLVLYLLLRGRSKWLNDVTIPIVIMAMALIVAGVKIGEGLKIVTVVQGGLRECWGITFFAMGLLLRQLKQRIPEHWAISLACLALLCVGTYLKWQGMTLTPKFRTVFTLPFTGLAGYLMLHHVSSIIDRHPSWLRNMLVYCGENTLYVFVFHISAFKIVSALKIMWYGLDWGQIGCHMVIHENSTDAFFLLYSVVGVVIPLLWIAAYRRIKQHIVNTRQQSSTFTPQP